MKHSKSHKAFTLVEVLTVVGVISILLALLMPAVQGAREASRRISCANKARQLAIASQIYEGSFRSLPIGQQAGTGKFPYRTWLSSLLPQLENEPLDRTIVAAYSENPSPFAQPVHIKFSVPVHSFACPSDSRAFESQLSRGQRVALTSYVGNAGVDARTRNGTLVPGQSVKLNQITDGLSSTFLFGERPASRDNFFGWWYAGYTDSAFALDSLLGCAETNRLSDILVGEICPEGPYRFGEPTGSQCDVFQNWSNHSGGAYFARCDSSVSFTNYHVDTEVMRRLSVRGDGESTLGP